MIAIILLYCLISLSLSSLASSQAPNGPSPLHLAPSNSGDAIPFDPMPLTSSSNVTGALDVVIGCFLPHPPPAPPKYYPATTLSCNAVIADILRHPYAMSTISWKRNTVPLTWNSDACSVTLNTQNLAAEDEFQIVLIARAAALLVKDCVTDFRGVKLGGKIVIGTKAGFNVTVIGAKIGGSATS